MAGFMGLRGLQHKTPRDLEKERREQERTAPQDGLEQRSREKVQEILSDQQEDAMSPAESPEGAAGGECERVARNTLGKIMSGRVAVLSFDDTLLTVHGIFSSVKFRHLPVVDDNGRVIGIISDRDFLRIVSPFFGTVNEQARDREIMARKVGVIMTRNPVCAGVDTTIIDAVKMMNAKKISCMPVVEYGSNKLLGIVTWKDVVRAFCPRGFNPARDSQRLKTGVHVNPESSESARLRARTSESARLRVAGDTVRRETERVGRRGEADTERMERPRPAEPGP